MEKIPGIEGITDEQINKMILQYNKVVEILKEDCIKKGITFVGYCYFRNGDSIKAKNIGSFFTYTDLDFYDRAWCSTDFRATILFDD